jgi:hypothetical protein
MRIFFVGVLSVTLIGCSCPPAPQAMLDACTSKPCFFKTAASSPPDLKPARSKTNSAATKVRSKNAAKNAKTSPVATKAVKPNSPRTNDGFDKEKVSSPTNLTPDASPPPPQPVTNAKSDVGTSVNVAALGPASGPSDPILEKAKATIASKMEDPASAEFEDMARAVRQDTFGQSIDTICGHVRGKNTAGVETGKRAFLYLVKEDIAFVDYGFSNSRAANAYRAVCTRGN